VNIAVFLICFKMLILFRIQIILIYRFAAQDTFINVETAVLLNIFLETVILFFFRDSLDSKEQHLFEIDLCNNSYCHF